MTDYTELKRLAEAANAVTSDVDVEMTIASETGPNQAEIDAVTAFIAAANPSAVLALIAENERLVAACERAEQIIIVECKEASFAKARANLLETERDQLKAENEVLRSALAALLDLYDTDEGCRNLPQYIAGRAAMSKGEQS